MEFRWPSQLPSFPPVVLGKTLDPWSKLRPSRVGYLEGCLWSLPATWWDHWDPVEVVDPAKKRLFTNSIKIILRHSRGITSSIPIIWVPGGRTCCAKPVDDWDNVCCPVRACRLEAGMTWTFPSPGMFWIGNACKLDRRFEPLRTWVNPDKLEAGIIVTCPDPAQTYVKICSSCSFLATTYLKSSIAAEQIAIAVAVIVVVVADSVVAAVRPGY